MNEKSFDELEADRERRLMRAFVAMQTLPPPAPTEVPVRTKSIRNHRCPCGSGKKFKACCMPGRPRHAAPVPSQP